MVRICAVEGCTSSDLTCLSHRFPKSLPRAKEWQDALELQDKDLETMLEKNTVCTLHFEKKDYRNIESRHLNKTALPKLVTSFWKPPQREKTYEIALEMVDKTDKNALHVNIVNNSNGTDPQDVDAIDQSSTVVEVMEELREHSFRAINPNDKHEEFYIVVESEDTNDDQRPQKRKNTESSSMKNKKSCPIVKNDHTDVEEGEEEEDQEEVEYGFESTGVIVYRDNFAQTDGEEEVDEEIINSEYWKSSKADLIRMLLERDQKCKELEKKIEDFRHAKEKMLQSIEMMKMM